MLKRDGPSVNISSGPIIYKRKITVEATEHWDTEGSGTGMTSIGIIPTKASWPWIPVLSLTIPDDTFPDGFALRRLAILAAIRVYKIDLFADQLLPAIQRGTPDDYLYP